MTEKRNGRRSWKSEAERLEALLVRACRMIDHSAISADGSEVIRPRITDDAQLKAWWEGYQLAHAEDAQRLRETALRKLSKDERDALGL